VSGADERTTKKRRPRATVGERLQAIVEAPTGQRVKRVRPVTNGETWTVTLEDGASFRLASAIVTELGLGVGVEWTDALAASARARQGVAMARHDGLMTLQRRAVTAKGLVDTLARKGHAREDAREAVEALARVGLIDDARVAEAAARSIARKEIGRAHV
jgi:hypothetical protein